MEAKASGRLAGKQEDDIDHYFLPGGILDTHQEEDMIGGSLLDEIGGVGNVTLQPPLQTPVSRVVGLEPQANPLTARRRARQPQQLHKKPTSVSSGGRTRLSVEGTNPMAKEFTPSTSSLPSETMVEAHSGDRSGNLPARFSAPETSNRAFSPAVGSEVKTAAAEPSYRTAIQRQLRKPPGPPGPDLPPQARGLPCHDPSGNAAAQPLLGNRGQQHPRHYQGAEKCFGKIHVKMTTYPLTSSLGTTAGQGHFPSPGFPPRGMVQQRTPQRQVQGSGISLGPSQRLKRGGPTKHHGAMPGQYVDRSSDPNDRVPTSRPGGPRFVGVAHDARPQQQKNRKGTPQGQAHQQVDRRIRTTAKIGCDGGRHALHHEAGGRTRRVDQNQAVPEDSCHDTAETRLARVYRSPDGPLQGAAHNAPTKVGTCLMSPVVRCSEARGAGICCARPWASTSLKISKLHAVVAEPGKDKLSRPEQAGLSSTARHQPRVGYLASDDDDSSRRTAISCSIQHTPSSGIGNDSERSARQAKPEDEPAGHAHSQKEKERTKLKRKDDKAYRSAPKQSLGTAVKEVSRTKNGIRPNLYQWVGLLGGHVRCLSLVVVAAIERAMTWQFNRLRLVGRMLTFASFAASSGATLLSMLMMSTSWLFVLGLRLHSLAVKEVTGSVHVAVCFLFPYCFQYLVAAIDEWAPHWLPSCLWYSFLMQMFCTPSHQCKHSMSSHLVPALRALLPVAFLCEVPSGRSYLLALGGSELLLLSFTLAAVRLRCVFSPIFLLCWASQVFALATCGSTASLQYGQVLVSLASLHAVSMVDVMLNSRFYHARYRAGMSLTNGFRAISCPSGLIV
ncbi:unnamed protein product [Scytosiphon promiscuus]